jgi:hypothetical protein
MSDRDCHPGATRGPWPTLADWHSPSDRQTDSRIDTHHGAETAVEARPLS